MFVCFLLLDLTPSFICNSDSGANISSHLFYLFNSLFVREMTQRMFSLKTEILAVALRATFENVVIWHHFLTTLLTFRSVV